MSNIDMLLSPLDKVRRTGPDRWIACCPAHDDKNPSLNIRETGDGTLLIKCWAGCSVNRVVEALGLEIKDLFPNKLDNRPPCKPHNRWIPRDVVRALADDCLLLAVFASALAEGHELSPKDHDTLIQVARKFNAIAIEVTDG